MACSCGTFTIAGTNATIFLNKPYWDSANQSISNKIDIFDFWNDDRSTVNQGINNQPLNLKGMEQADCGDNSGWSPPICFPLCFSGCMSKKFDLINDMIDNHEAVIITGLKACLNGVYIIKRFSFRYVESSVVGYEWNLLLARKRDI